MGSVTQKYQNGQIQAPEILCNSLTNRSTLSPGIDSKSVTRPIGHIYCSAVVLIFLNCPHPPNQMIQ